MRIPKDARIWGFPAGVVLVLGVVGIYQFCSAETSRAEDRQPLPDARPEQEQRWQGEGSQ